MKAGCVKWTTTRTETARILRTRILRITIRTETTITILRTIITIVRILIEFSKTKTDNKNDCLDFFETVIF